MNDRLSSSLFYGPIFHHYGKFYNLVTSAISATLLFKKYLLNKCLKKWVKSLKIFSDWFLGGKKLNAWITNQLFFFFPKNMRLFLCKVWWLLEKYFCCIQNWERAAISACLCWLAYMPPSSAAQSDTLTRLHLTQLHFYLTTNQNVRH